MIRTQGTPHPQAVRQGMVLLILLLGGSLAMGLGLKGPEVSAKTQDNSSKLPAGLALVPLDAVGFVHVRVADLWNSELGKNYRLRFPKHAAETERGFESTLAL